ncbi:MAG: recombinase RecT, partial [Selenomonadaceae bacterium]|nr:recombinase RecT [Selenomonadaceae bacterium]
MATQSLVAYVHDHVIENRFVEVLGKEKAKVFISTLISIYNGNHQLKECDPRSIASAAGLAAITGLSISPTLGQAYIVP